jgi:hypothetical protein
LAISSGRREGISNKIGAMQRMDYGFGDFNRLSLRILTLYRAKHIFTDDPLFHRSQKDSNAQNNAQFPESFAIST